jgi:hypothetical protein
MTVVVQDAPVWAMPPVPSAPVRQSSRSTTDQFKEHSFIVCEVHAVENFTPARILCGSWAHALPDETEFNDIVGLTTAPHSQRYISTVSVDHQSLASFRNRALLARLRKHMPITVCQLDTMTTSPELHFRWRTVDLELKRSLGRLNYLRSLPDGWLGGDSCGASEDTGKQAEKLLRRIRREVPSAPLPVLGLDTDGTIVMSWSRGDLVGSMTIYGDGTFSYFVRRNAASAKNINAMIDQPLGKDLTDLLAP